MHSNSLAAASCIQATLFEKIDDLPFPPLSGQIVIRRFSGAQAWEFNLAQVKR